VEFELEAASEDAHWRVNACPSTLARASISEQQQQQQQQQRWEAAELLQSATTASAAEREAVVVDEPSLQDIAADDGRLVSVCLSGWREHQHRAASSVLQIVNYAC